MRKALMKTLMKRIMTEIMKKVLVIKKGLMMMKKKNKPLIREKTFLR